MKLSIDRYYGKFDTREIISFTEKQNLDMDYLKIEYLIVDFRNSTTFFSEDEVIKILNVDRPKEFQQNIKKIALIADSPETYVSNFFFKENVIKRMNVQVDIFSTLKGALCFLELEIYHKMIKESIDDMEE